MKFVTHLLNGSEKLVETGVRQVACQNAMSDAGPPRSRWLGGYENKGHHTRTRASPYSNLLGNYVGERTKKLCASNAGGFGPAQRAKMTTRWEKCHKWAGRQEASGTKLQEAFAVSTNRSTLVKCMYRVEMKQNMGIWLT